MGNLVRRRPSAAMVVAVIALVIAASGTAVAATKLARGDSLIRKNSLSGNRLKDGSVDGAKLNLSSLGTVPNAAHAARADIATSALSAGSATTALTASSATQANTAAAAPIAKLSYVTANFSVPNDGTPTTGTVSCPAGTNVTGGGANIDDTVDSTFVAGYPAGKTGWNAVYEDTGSPTPVTATVYAICAPAAATG